jgi:hypothetical protein
MCEDINRRRFLTTGAMTMAGIQLGLIGFAKERSGSAVDRLPVEGKLPSFDGASGWLNSQPLTTAGLRGKVVLVDFWTALCPRMGCEI